ADQTFVYFLSDGQPTTPVLNVPQWESFLTTNGIQEAIAVGVGSDFTNASGDPGKAALETVAFPNDPTDNNPIIVTAGHEQDIFNDLVQTVTKVVTGNIFTDATLTPDQFGVDGKGLPAITQIVVGNHTLTSATLPVDFGDGIHVISNAAGILVVTTGLGGQLTFDFNTGDYSYNVPPTAGTESFQYTIQDFDNDTSQANLTFNVAYTSSSNPHLHLGTTGDDAAINGDLNAINIIGGGDGNDSIHGGNVGDHITGGAGADTIIGGSGNDVIIGGTTSEQVGSDNIRLAD